MPRPSADPTNPSFSVEHDAEPGGALIAGFSSFGLAGLTAVDYLVDDLGLTATGHVRIDGVPSITPFTKGTPRHPIRLYAAPDLDITVLVAEQFVPPFLGELLADALLDWTEANGVEEIAVLAGVPVAHGPDAHRTFHVATEDYRAARLEGGPDVPAMESGFLDGANAGLLERGLDSPLGVGVFVTPVHAQAPDAEAAVRLVDTANAVYDLGVDAGPLEAFAQEIQRRYEDLAERIEEREPEGSYDRMYM
ncbi:proteasome assembly chaperone family protein [Halorubrum sp. Atlit-8R]|uniref:proteasome assembly chaperone family protein n=1 Tax=unclassified Halorubrum TaxID=2642239 RepID=UPI000EF2541F|nr:MULTISPECIES: PAC2 family protein [unclassified Halorubrum]RLM63979.1 proteasome assembly chaperone family protein [Halorubrum sp. Atlit-9R]RLM77356.1 proteasome assembly chaperone family protein [Halorubrum sp. Atlit-8R]